MHDWLDLIYVKWIEQNNVIEVFKELVCVSSLFVILIKKQFD